MSEIIETPAETTDMCGWFATCSNESFYLISHPMNRAGVTCCSLCFEILVKLSGGKVHDDVIATRC